MTMLEDSLLGKKVRYEATYNSELLYPIPRSINRESLGVLEGDLPFQGEDLWNLFELSWLDESGKPVIATAEVRFAIDSINLVESKSFKMYLNSFNQTMFESRDQVRKTMEDDLSLAVNGRVSVLLDPPALKKIAEPEAVCIDDEPIETTTYTFRPEFLEKSVSFHGNIVDEKLCSHLFKSNCPVTGQPDWASIFIDYHGPVIDRKRLLQYLISFRQHQEFHEQCVERIFIDLKKYCHAERLTVLARYTRRGGLDINPFRTDMNTVFENIRLERQ